MLLTIACNQLLFSIKLFIYIQSDLRYIDLIVPDTFNLNLTFFVQPFSFYFFFFYFAYTTLYSLREKFSYHQRPYTDWFKVSYTNKHANYWLNH